MCVLAFAWRMHPDWPIVLAGNRDELHARPAAPLHRWPQPPGLIAGQDLESGGTWLGVAEGAGRLAVVTNLRGFGPPRQGAPSRSRIGSTWPKNAVVFICGLTGGWTTRCARTRS